MEIAFAGLHQLCTPMLSHRAGLPGPQASAQALAFVARRLLAERVALVFAVRDPSEMRPLGDLPPLMVEGLKSAGAGALLDSAWRGTRRLLPIQSRSHGLRTGGPARTSAR
jgi:hypothetical protein